MQYKTEFRGEMNDWWIWMGLFISCSLVCISVYLGELNVIRRDRRGNLVHSKGPWEGWLTIAVVSLVLAAITSFIAANPIERLKANADKVRSQYTTEGALK